MRLGEKIVKHRIFILILSFLLVIPSVLGMVKTRINYDMLTYLPEDMETVQGQNILMDQFGKGAFSFIILEDLSAEDVSALKNKISEVDHVDTVLWYDSIMDLDVPMEMLPDKVLDVFNSGNKTMMAVFFDSSTSADETVTAVQTIRQLTDEHCFVSGMSAMITDLKELCEQEEPIYVALAVALAIVAMMITLDSYLAPFVFLLSIGVAIIINLGSNYFLGEISYITKALSAVLQLAVTMDYSIFLWESYNEEKQEEPDSLKAMAKAIDLTLSSVLGSSITTIAGFIALCFMSYSLGKDLGIVMAKGVVLGVIGCVTILPALIILLEKPLEKSKHKPLIGNTSKLAHKITSGYVIILICAALVAVPAYLGYTKANDEVYYQISESLPQDLSYAIANKKLEENFSVGSTHMMLISTEVSSNDMRAMIEQMEKVDGVQNVLALESFVGPLIPDEMISKEIRSKLESDQWELVLINSEYKVASDEVNEQISELNEIMKQVDSTGLLIGEAPCTKDLIEVTNKDFAVVNSISIIAIFIIIMLVEKSISLPFILVSVIELAIFINLGICHYTNTSLAFIAPICISTIQLGATVDYAILMTTRYKRERANGKEKQEAVETALSASIPSIIVSAFGLFAATFGVALYSDIDMIGSLCNLIARGAIISMVCVILILPSLLMVFDKLIGKTSFKR